MDALKPCPFCGGAMELIHDHTTEDIDRIRHRIPQINCPINGASGFSVGNDQLVAAWNHRPEAERLVEALESATVALEEASKVLIGKGLPAFADVVFGHAERNNALLSSLKGTEG